MLTSLWVWRLTLRAHRVVFGNLNTLLQNFICQICFFRWGNVASVFAFAKKCLWGLIGGKFQKRVALDRAHWRILRILIRNERLTPSFLVQVPLFALNRPWLHCHQCVIAGVLAGLGPLLLHKCSLICSQLQTIILNICLRLMPWRNRWSYALIYSTSHRKCVHFVDSCVVHWSPFILLFLGRFIFWAIHLFFTVTDSIKCPYGLVVKNSAHDAFLRKTGPISIF